MAPPRPLHANWFLSAELPELRLVDPVAVPPFDWPAAPAFARTCSSEGRGQPRLAARDWSAAQRGRARAARSASPGARGAATAASVASVASGSVASGSTAAGIARPHPPQPRPGRPPAGRPAGTPSAAGQVSGRGQGRGSGVGNRSPSRGTGRGPGPGSGVGVWDRGSGRGRAGVGTRDRGRESRVGSRGRGPGRGWGVKLGPGPGSLWSRGSAAHGRVRCPGRAGGAGLSRSSPAESPEDPRPARTNLDGSRVVCRAGRGGAGGGVREVPAGLWGAPSSS